LFKEDVYFNDGDALYLDYEMKITEGEVLDTYHHTSKELKEFEGNNHMGDFKVEGNHASDNATVIKSGPSQGVVLGKTYKVVKISGKFHAGGDHASGNICNSPQGSTDGVEENDESSAVETNTQHEEDLFYTLMFRGYIMCK